MADEHAVSVYVAAPGNNSPARCRWRCVGRDHRASVQGFSDTVQMSAICAPEQVAVRSRCGARLNSRHRQTAGSGPLVRLLLAGRRYPRLPELAAVPAERALSGGSKAAA